MTEASKYLRTLAARVAAAYILHTGPRAILLTGSAAQLDADCHSDIDLVVYYQKLPSEGQIRAAREQMGVEGVRDNKIYVDGVECDIGQLTLESCEQQLAKVLEHLDTETPAQKIVEGILHGIPLHGADIIEGWQARARTYPPGLAHAMVETHLKFFPIWRVQDWFAARDTTVWYYQTLVESSQHILGVLAGVNHLYFVPFHFKRMRRFIEQMDVAPENLVDRLEALFTAEYTTAVAELESLVGETVALVERHLPEVDTSMVRRDLGARRPPWTLPPGTYSDAATAD